MLNVDRSIIGFISFKILIMLYCKFFLGEIVLNIRKLNNLPEHNSLIVKHDNIYPSIEGIVIFKIKLQNDENIYIVYALKLQLDITWIIFPEIDTADSYLNIVTATKRYTFYIVIKIYVGNACLEFQKLKHTHNIMYIYKNA